MRTLRASPRLWLAPDWSNWPVIIAIVLLAGALVVYFYVS